MPPLYDPILDSPLFEIFSSCTSDTYFFVTDLRYDYSHWSGSVVREFGLSGEYMQDVRAEWLPPIHPDGRATYESNPDAMFAGKTGDIHCCEYRAQNKEGTYLWLRCKGKLRRDTAGVPTLFAGVINNLGPAAKYDYLTGLYTIHELSRRLSLSAEPCSLLLFSPDSFRRINDTYGYRFGNEVLCALATRFAVCLPDGIFYRMNGDKYADLLQGYL